MFDKHTPPVGSIPGALASVEKFPKPKIHVIDFDQTRLDEYDFTDPKELIPFKNSNSVSWIDIQGLGDENVLQQIADIFGLSPLTLSDIVNVPSRPKQETHDDYLLIISCMADIPNPPRINIEQISIILGAHFVLTFQENYGDVLDPIRNRLRQGRGIIRKSACDYLAYSIIDALVDGYYPVMETIGDQLEELEATVIAANDRRTLNEIYQIRRELLHFRRNVWPQREVIHGLILEPGKYFKKSIEHNLRDVYEHCFQIMDVIETYREICSGLTDVYLSGLSNRLNDIMKVLTIISTVFIPLTFITSIYGMNFQYMPELQIRWFYPLLWGVLLGLAGVMIFYFYKKGWLRSENN